MEKPQKRKLTTRLLCDRYNIVPRTVDRWVEQGILPKPMLINTVRYWDEDEIDRRDQERMAEANTAACRGSQDEMADAHAGEAA